MVTSIRNLELQTSEILTTDTKSTEVHKEKKKSLCGLCALRVSVVNNELTHFEKPRTSNFEHQT